MYTLKSKKNLGLILIYALIFIILVIGVKLFPWDECVLRWDFGLNWNAKLSMSKVYDNHGGFPVDGKRLYLVSFKDDDRTALETWDSLPMPPTINGLIYGHDGEISSTADEIGIPKVTSGKWKYIDRGNTSVGYEPFNFSICIYDDVKDVIYYYTCDT